MAKNGHVHEFGKIGRSNATPTIFFSVDFYDLKFMSFKFCNDIEHLPHGRKDYFHVKLSITTKLKKLCSFTKLFNSIYVQLSGVKCY